MNSDNPQGSTSTSTSPTTGSLPIPITTPMDQPDDTHISGKPTAASAATAATSSSPPPKNYSRTPTSWDAEDDILLMHLKDNQKLGWKEIASHFTNRTPNACQFRWRRLKSGNLKNPPKSAAALGNQINTKAMIAAAATAAANKKKKQVSTTSTPKVKIESTSTFTSAYSPLPQPTFQGFDNNISNALAGLNALSNSPSYISSPMVNTNPSTPRGLSITSPNGMTQQQQQQHRQNQQNQQQHSPNSDTSSSTPLENTGPGFYQDISVDPTMNIPGATPSSLTPRNSISQGSATLVQPHPPRTSITSTTSISRSGSISGIPPISVPSNNATALPTMPLRNNSIIQTMRDDRTSISSLARVSVSSLPSKSMNIPHHQTTNNALAHMPVLFGSTGGSISGTLSRNASLSAAAGVSGPVIGGGSGSVSGSISGGGIQQTSSLRNSSIVSTNSGYYSRSGSVVIPYNADKEEPLKIDKEKLDADIKKLHKKKIKTVHHRNITSTKSTTATSSKKSDTPNPPPLEIPWTMEEDELLINRRNRELSFAELSILLPQRTEGEIWARIDHLEKLRNGGHRATTSSDPRRNGIDFYDDDDDDDIIGGIGVSDDDDDDDDEDNNDVLVDTRKRKRRASSAVNPLSVGETIRKRL